MDWLTFEGVEGILHQDLAWLVHGFEYAAAAIDIVAILYLLLGTLRFVIGIARAEILRDGDARVARTDESRLELGRYILTGLQLFIVSDVIHTVLSLRFSDLLFLTLLVIVRSVISYFLERELKEVKKDLKDE